jgi:hypothetical protein
MHKFSERMGFKEHLPIIQTDGMSDALRNSLWNFLHTLYENTNNYWIPVAKLSARLFFKVPVDELPFHDSDNRKWLKARFYDLKWFEIYDYIEFIVNNHELIIKYTNPSYTELIEVFNIIFEEELSGFRFISGILAPISNPAETGEISSAIEATARDGLAGAHEHLRASLTLLGKKPVPDYRNSIKEAISAVESIAKQLTIADVQGLSGALDELSKNVDIHGALKAGFIKLYGYTSDEDGIRHAILEQPNVGFDEAKYMVVSCSAFVNYLIAKAQKAHLLK